MKKLLSLLMALVLMIVPFSALAQSNGGMQIYMKPDGSYGFAYPNDWTVISREVIDAAIEAGYAVGDGSLGNLFSELKYQMEQMDVTMVINIETGDRVELVCRDVGGMLPEDELLGNMQMFKMILEDSDPNIEFFGEPEIMDFGNGEHLYGVLMYRTVDTNGIPVNMVHALGSFGTLECSACTTIYSTDGEASLQAFEAMTHVLASFTLL